MSKEYELNGIAKAWNAGSELTTLSGEASIASFAATSIASGILWAKYAWDAASFAGTFIGCYD